jgi:hypothetical protein
MEDVDTRTPTASLLWKRTPPVQEDEMADRIVEFEATLVEGRYRWGKMDLETCRCARPESIVQEIRDDREGRATLLCHLQFAKVERQRHIAAVVERENQVGRGANRNGAESQQAGYRAAALSDADTTAEDCGTGGVARLDCSEGTADLSRRESDANISD